MAESPDCTVTTPRARVKIQHAQLSVMPIGLGCMGMSQSYGPANDDESLATIRGALDRGVQMLDTSDIYGAADVAQGLPPHFGHNEELIGRAIAGRREDAVIASKFGTLVGPDNVLARSGRPEYVALACEASLRRLGVEVIDLYYYHRVDPAVPIEETVGAMSELVRQGKVRAIGLSEVDAATLRNASQTFPIAVLQSEYSLWERGIEDEVLPACRELGVTLVPFSPLGRAMLTGTLTSPTALTGTDFRSTIPKFSGDHFAANRAVVSELEDFARTLECTPGQVALAWLLAQPHDVVPIPGTKRLRYVEQNVAATAVRLSAEDVALLNQMFAPERISGARYDARRMPDTKLTTTEDA